jgi:hypothetical protein
MKKLLLSLLATLVLTGCSEGPTFLKFWWTPPLYYYMDNNPSVPYALNKNVYYPTGTGTYSFYYEPWDGSGWYGSYSIVADEGLFGGDPQYFELSLLSFGPSFYTWDSPLGISEGEPKSESSPWATCEFSDELNTEVCKETKKVDGYTAELEYYRYTSPDASQSENKLP